MHVYDCVEGYGKFEFSTENNNDTTRYLLDMSAISEQEICRLPQKEEAKYEGEARYCEIAAFIYFGEAGCSEWEYTFEVFKLEDGYHVVMTKSEDDHTEEHNLTETKRIDKLVDINNLVTFFNGGVVN